MLREKYAERIEQLFAKYPADRKRSAVMSLLYIAQEAYGYLPQHAIDEVAELVELDPTQVKSIAGFYTMFRETPKGKYWLHVCTDLACALKGADQFYHDLEAYLGLKHGEDTTKDGLFTLEHVMCLGACDRAPMMQCNFHFYENLDNEKVQALIEQWRADVNAVVSTPS